ncbi:serine/arginine repetitive matrix protein 2-like [Rhagoletis pomonella]|uniref:serine/arginine repetitive matrix protein 2-like n=1 Tax=Rhagoletis pomonella TaxID=28610 RepID=UPI001783F534|nr:serine/arginine repetitive matrix protein 2-like [Rhagoletis pomonella]
MSRAPKVPTVKLGSSMLGEGKGTRRRGGFLASLSEEEAALFIEHAREDERPSTSSGGVDRAQLRSEGTKGAEALASKNRHRSPSRNRGASWRRSRSRDRSRSHDRSGSRGRSEGRHRSKSRHRSGSGHRSSSRHRRSPSRTSSLESGWQLQDSKKRSRRCRPPPLPPSGQPGALDDHHRAGLSGSGVKWYLRYLEQGKKPSVARAMAEVRQEVEKEAQESGKTAATAGMQQRGELPAPAEKQRSGQQHQRPAPAEKQRSGQQQQRPAPAEKQRSGLQHQKPAPAEKQRSGQQQQRPAPAKWRRSGEPTGTTTGSTTATPKRTSLQVTPPEPPSPKRPRGLPPPPTESRGLDGSAGQGQPQEGITKQPSYSDALKGIRVAVLPCDYPAAALSPEDLTKLQDAIMDEVLKGWKHALVFCGVFFRSGMLLVDCKDERTAAWLVDKAPNIEGWEGPALCTKRGDDIPPVHNISVFFPRCADKSAEYVLGLIKAQNEDIHTAAWKVVSCGAEDNGLRLNLGIDEASYVSIKRAGFTINFRYSFVTVRPWRHKTTGSKESESQDMQVDETTDSTAAPATESTTAPLGDQLSELAQAPALVSAPGPSVTDYMRTTQELLADISRLELDREGEGEARLSNIEDEPQL